MSSHHVVRDQQEPALLIENSAALDFAMVQSLLEWSPTVIVVEDALTQVMDWGIKIDVVVAEFKSMDLLKPQLKSQSPVKLLGFENGNQLQNAYQYLLDEGYSAVNILADIFNSQVLNLAKLYDREIDSVIFNSNQKWIYSRLGFFEKWVNPGQLFAVHPVRSNTFLTTLGFYGDWENEMLLEPLNLTSEHSGKVVMKTNNCPLWVVEDLSH